MPGWCSALDSPRGPTKDLCVFYLYVRSGWTFCKVQDLGSLGEQSRCTGPQSGDPGGAPRKAHASCAWHNRVSGRRGPKEAVRTSRILRWSWTRAPASPEASSEGEDSPSNKCRHAPGAGFQPIQHVVAGPSLWSTLRPTLQYLVGGGPSRMRCRIVPMSVVPPSLGSCLGLQDRNVHDADPLPPLCIGDSHAELSGIGPGPKPTLPGNAAIPRWSAHRCPKVPCIRIVI